MQILYHDIHFLNNCSLKFIDVMYDEKKISYLKNEHPTTE